MTAAGPTVFTLLRMTADRPEPVAALTSGPDGEVRLVVLTSSAAADSLRAGIYAAHLDRVVTLADGRLFLDTLLDLVAGSAYWSVTDR